MTSDDDQLPLFGGEEPRAWARSGDPATSWEAARSVQGIRETQAEVLFVLRRAGPMTDEEIWTAVNSTFPKPHSPSGVRSRRAELVEAGFVRGSDFRLTRAKRRTTVWEAAL